MTWQAQRHDELPAAIAEFKTSLPGWWFTVGECQVSCHASCGPTRESPDINRIKAPRRLLGRWLRCRPSPAINPRPGPPQRHGAGPSSYREGRSGMSEDKRQADECYECGHDLNGPWCPACNPAGPVACPDCNKNPCTHTAAQQTRADVKSVFGSAGTLRDEFAMAALSVTPEGWCVELRARKAYQIADAMMEARKQ